VRQGPLRLRLRAPPGAPDEAADPQGRRDQGPRPPAPRPALERSLPRGQLGRGAGPRRRHAEIPARHPRQEGAGGLRLRQGQQRRGLPVPEAGAHRLRQQQRGPLHPPVPCLQRGRAARRRRLGRGEQPGARRGARRLHPHHRLQPHGQPPGGRHLDQERRRPWCEAGAGRPAPHRPRPPRLARAAVPCRHRRGPAQRDAARHRHRGPDGRGLHPRARRRLRGAEGQPAGLQPRGHGADLRHCGRDDSRGGARLRHRQGFHDPLGHGREPACARHRQRALPDRAGQASPARSAAPAPACTRCAARTTCRAPATPGSSP
jgi:hypothetical protein